jgi:hypothetical protein
MIPNLLMMHLVITLGYEYVPLEYGVRYTAGLLRHQWEFFYILVAELLKFIFDDFKDLEMMETVVCFKNIDNYAYFNWNEFFSRFGI